MSIIIHDMESPASFIGWKQGALDIRFDDPAYVRAEQVLVERVSRRVGVVFEQGYHALGLLPAGIEIEALHIAHLSGGTQGLCLRAPVKLTN